MEQNQSETCIAAGASLPDEILKSGFGPDCQAQTLRLAGGRIDLAASCPAVDGAPALTIEGRGTYSPDGWQLTVDVDEQGSRTRGTDTARRIGDC